MTLQTIVLGASCVWLLSLGRGLQRWVTLFAFILVACGVSVFWIAEETYLNFAFSAVQAVTIVMATSFYTIGKTQKTLVGVTIFVLMAAHLVGPVLGLDSLDKIEHRIYLSMAFAFLPVLLFSTLNAKFENLKRVLVFQQSWLRVSFLFWSSSQAVNIHHYEVFDRFAQEFAYISLGAVALALLIKRYIQWSFVHQSILTLFVFVMSLYAQGRGQDLLLAWIILIAISELFPREAPPALGNLAGFVRRLEHGALGGGYFWTLLIGIAITVDQASRGAILWTIVAFFVGVIAWIVQLPEGQNSEEPSPRGFALFSRILAQVLIAALFVFWPHFLI